MKYIVQEIQTDAAGNVAILPAITREDRLEAESEYHRILTFAAISTLPLHTAVLTTADGKTLSSKCYKHSAPVQDTEESADQPL